MTDYLHVLTCTVEVGEGSPTVQWLDSDGVVTTGGDITVGASDTSGTTTTLTLIFDPLYTSHGGEYTCQSEVGSVMREDMMDVCVQSELYLQIVHCEKL